MTRAELSNWWERRGSAWSHLQEAERALLAIQAQWVTDIAMRSRVEEALGCLAGARELLGLATARAEYLASQLKPEAQP